MPWLLRRCGQAIAIECGAEATVEREATPLFFPSSCVNLKRNDLNKQGGSRGLPDVFLLVLRTHGHGAAQTQPGPLPEKRSVRSLSLCSLRRQAWDLAVDICLSQLPTIIEEGTAFRVSPAKGIRVVVRGGRGLHPWAPGPQSPQPLGCQISFGRLGKGAVSRSLKDDINQEFKTWNLKRCFKAMFLSTCFS